MSQVQGRTYANTFGLVERYIDAKTLELTRDYRFGDQVALEALVRFSDEELKHQELFRRVEALAASAMPRGYASVADPNAVAQFVLSKSTWSVLALTTHIEIFTQVHYKKSIEPATARFEQWRQLGAGGGLGEEAFEVVDGHVRVSRPREQSTEDRGEVVGEFGAEVCPQRGEVAPAAVGRGAAEGTGAGC